MRLVIKDGKIEFGGNVLIKHIDFEVNDNSKIVISKSNYYAEFIRIKSDEFYDILNCKLTQRRI